MPIWYNRYLYGINRHLYGINRYLIGIIDLIYLRYKQISNIVMEGWIVRIGDNLSTKVGVRDTRTILVHLVRYICIWQSEGVKIYCEKEDFDMVTIVKPGINVNFDGIEVSIEKS